MLCLRRMFPQRQFNSQTFRFPSTATAPTTTMIPPYSSGFFYTGRKASTASCKSKLSTGAYCSAIVLQVLFGHAPCCEINLVFILGALIFRSGLRMNQTLTCTRPIMDSCPGHRLIDEQSHLSKSFWRLVYYYYCILV